MCRVGVRCYADSNAKLQSVEAKLNPVDSELKLEQKNLSVAAHAGDFNLFSKGKEKITVLETKRASLVAELNAAQRDVDGTSKGQKLLEEQMKNVSSMKDFESLRVRKNQGEANAYVHLSSAELKKRGKGSPIFLPGEKKPSRAKLVAA